MNYPCKLIQDLLPLYHDGVCSNESQEIIKEHLSGCKDCTKYYDALCESDTVPTPKKRDIEVKKAESLKSVGKQIRRGKMIAAAAVLPALIAVFVTVFATLKLSLNYSVPQDISVSTIDGDIVGRLNGSRYAEMSIKRVPKNGSDGDYIFFNIKDSNWDRLMTSEKMYSEFVLVYADKGAESVDEIYFYAGDDEGLESMTEAELQKVIDESVLMWKK